MNRTEMKLGTKLALSFGVIVVLMLVMVTASTLRIQTIGDHITEILEDRFVKITLAMDLDAATNIQNRSLRNAIIGIQDAELVRTSIAAIDKAKADSKTAMSTLAGLVNTPQGKELYQNLERANAEFGQRRDELVRLIQQGKADVAGTYLLATMRPAQTAYLESIGAFKIYVSQQMEEAGAAARAAGASAIQLTLGIALVSVILAAVLAVNVTRRLTRQLGGEPGDVADLAKAIAGGDLSRSIAVRAGDTDSVVAQMAAMQSSLATVVSTVRLNSESLATASTQIAQGNLDLSQRTEEQASNLQQTAASMEQLSGTVKTSADTAYQANQLASSASSAAARGGETVGQVVATMQDIAAASRKIGDIIGVIDGIAFQTNILALNAAVEAARAGEQGRGFAVVAGEVRNLAHRSAEAAKEIKSLIGASVDKVEAGTRQVDEAGQSMTDIVSQVQRVSDLIGELSAAASEQTTGIGQVGDAVNQLDQVTQQNAALVEESAAAADSLKLQAANLVEAVAVFKLDLNAAQGAASVRRSPARPAARPASAPRPAAKAKAVATPPVASATPAVKTVTASSDDDWAQF